MEAPFGMPDLTLTLLNAVRAPVVDRVKRIGFTNRMLGQVDSPLEAPLFGLYARFAYTVMSPGGREYHAVHTSRYTFMCLFRKALVAG